MRYATGFLLTALCLAGCIDEQASTPEPDDTADADVERITADAAAGAGYEVDAIQSNHEGEIVDRIHAARDRHDAIIINPGAYSHTSIAIRDALSGVDIPVWEVHISNIHARESFRHHSYISAIAKGVICGCGILGYRLAIMAALDALEG